MRTPDERGATAFGSGAVSRNGCLCRPARGRFIRWREHWVLLPVTRPEGRLGPVQIIEDFIMSLGTILVILLILILLGVIPSWGYSGNWGYGPSGIVGTILVIVVILLLLGKI